MAREESPANDQSTFPGWVLSLSDAVDRRRSVELALRGVECLRWSFFNAIDGRGGRKVDAPYARERTLRWQGYPLTMAEIALVEGHRRMWSGFLGTGEPVGAFFEDDVRVGPGFCSSLRAAVKLAGTQWDVLRLEMIWPGRVIRAIADLEGESRLVLRGHACRGAAAYMLTRHAAKILLKRTDPFWLPMDIIIDRYWDHGLRVRAIDPAPCSQDTNLGSVVGVRRKPHLSLVTRAMREISRAVDLARRAAFHLSLGRR